MIDCAERIGTFSRPHKLKRTATDVVPAFFNETGTMPHKSKTEYQIFWLVNGERIDAYNTMEQRVLAGAIAVEVSVERQQAEAERNQLLHNWARTKRERFNRELIALQFENSPEGQRAAALRTAAENPGGIVTVAELNGNFAELDAFGRRNNPFKI